MLVVVVVVVVVVVAGEKIEELTLGTGKILWNPGMGYRCRYHTLLHPWIIAEIRAFMRRTSVPRPETLVRWTEAQ